MIMKTEDGYVVVSPNGKVVLTTQDKAEARRTDRQMSKKTRKDRRTRRRSR